MSERVRSIHVRIEVDTNKRTFVIDKDVDSFSELSRIVDELPSEFE